MCGIFCCITDSSAKESDLIVILEQFQDSLKRRGPDSFEYMLHKTSESHVILASSVLWLQGAQLAKQPVQNSKSIFIYNGDLYNLKPESGDTYFFLECLENNMKLDILQGPYAFVYMDKANERLYFGKDAFGRRSLLIGKSNKTLILSSIARRKSEFNFTELPSLGLFYLNLKSKQVHLLPLKRKTSNFESKLKDLERILETSIILESLTLQLCEFQHKLPNDHYLNLMKKTESLSVEARFDYLLKDYAFLQNVLKLKELLLEALQVRISAQLNYCKICLMGQLNCNHSTTGILFSGGVDCGILALLSDSFVDQKRPIDLINVAFENKNGFVTPDRSTGLATLAELQKIKPTRQWNFIDVNVKKEELDENRRKIIADLIYPESTILDDSLGSALWFAARGESDIYSSPCRVLIVGMGADELFGGYTKYRKAFGSKSWEGVDNCLETDWENLPYRNLARDDRVVSDHGRQLRTPYLDEKVVEFVQNLQSWERTWPNLNEGFGEKILLRSLAFYLGLKNACSFKKRALQFGSRIANSKENAHEASPRLLS